MNCKELVYLLEDYLDGSMEGLLKEELSAHIEKCEPCMSFLKTYSATRDMCRKLRPEEIPEELRVRLKSFVVEKARERRKDIDKYLAIAAAERRADVETILNGFLSGRLPPTLADLFGKHREGCGKCAEFLKSLNGGKSLPPVPPEFEEHIADFIEELPPGEFPPEE